MKGRIKLSFIEWCKLIILSAATLFVVFGVIYSIQQLILLNG